YRDTQCISSDARNRIQVFDRIIEGPTLEQGFVDVRLSSAEQERVAIRARARDSRSTERRTATANVFNHHGSDERFHFVRQWAADKVECAAWRKRHHEPDWPCRKGLRLSEARDGRQCGSAGGQTQKGSAAKLHGGVLPDCDGPILGQLEEVVLRPMPRTDLELGPRIRDKCPGQIGLPSPLPLPRPASRASTIA